MRKSRVLTGAIALAIVGGTVLTGPAAYAATHLHGPYKTKAACNAARADVAVHASVRECFSWPRRGYYFRAES